MMTAQQVLAKRDRPIKLVIFDCDGVLIDSEGLAAKVVSSELRRLGWAITEQECEDRFLGSSLREIIDQTETAIGRPVPLDFGPVLGDLMIEALRTSVEAIPGAQRMLERLTEAGLPWRVASNSTHAEMAVKFGRTGLSRLVGDRQHSAEDMMKIGLNGKPDPHLFLAAAEAGHAAPEDCLVIEDSVPGARAARAAGMTCLGFTTHGSGEILAQEGAGIFRDMAELPGLLGLAKVAA